jgi:hypothetical protein
MTSTMSVATMGILFRWFPLILDGFWYETSYIGNVVSLPLDKYVEHRKRSTDAILMSILVWMWPCHSSHGYDDVIMYMTIVIILVWWFLLILNEFWHKSGCIRKIISLPFCAYVEHPKQSIDVIVTSVLVWMWSCHSSYRHDDVIMPVTTVSILFWWFSLIPYEFWHETSCIEKIILLPFCAYVEYIKRSLDVILMSILVCMWPCHNSHRHDNVSNVYVYCGK